MFRAGPKQTEPEVIYAELDDDLPDFDAALPLVEPMAPLVASTPQPVAALPASTPSYQSPRAILPPQQKRKAATDTPATDYKQQISGFFLISLPIIATVLPFFGLQFKVLSMLGDYAPLAAIVFGLIGVILIFSARGAHSDRWIVAGVLAGFVLTTGIGGYLLIASFNDSHIRKGFTGDWNTGGPVMSTAEKRKEADKMYEEHRKEMEILRKEREIEFEKQQQERQARIEATRKRSEELRRQGKVFKGRLPSAEELMNGAKLPEFPINN